jgi:hypothetical protein
MYGSPHSRITGTAITIGDASLLAYRVNDLAGAVKIGGRMYHPGRWRAAAIVLLSWSASHISAAEKTGFTHSQICKAGIAVIMGRNPATMTVDRVEKDVLYLSYVRPDDRKRWAYKCRIEGQRIIWGADDSRWRTEDILTFSIADSTLSVIESYTDGSAKKKTFTVDQLGK